MGAQHHLPVLGLGRVTDVPGIPLIALSGVPAVASV
jgi:hypothetical protein